MHQAKRHRPWRKAEVISWLVSLMEGAREGDIGNRDAHGKGKTRVPRCEIGTVGRDGVEEEGRDTVPPNQR